MTGEPEEHYPGCAGIMERVEAGRERVSTSVFTVAEIRHILEKREKIGQKKATRMVLSLLDCLGLKLLDAEAMVCREALETADRFKVDFVDACNVLTMRRNRLREIYSLDEHYDRFPDIKRLL
jgi:predicted nucleic acid-binding protein